MRSAAISATVVFPDPGSPQTIISVGSEMVLSPSFQCRQLSRGQAFKETLGSFRSLLRHRPEVSSFMQNGSIHFNPPVPVMNCVQLHHNAARLVKIQHDIVNTRLLRHGCPRTRDQITQQTPLYYSCAGVETETPRGDADGLVRIEPARNDCSVIEQMCSSSHHGDTDRLNPSHCPIAGSELDIQDHVIAELGSPKQDPWKQKMDDTSNNHHHAHRPNEPIDRRRGSVCRVGSIHTVNRAMRSINLSNSESADPRLKP